MKIFQSIGSLLKLGVIVGCIYVAVTWGFEELQSDENIQIAERDCAHEITRLHGAQSVSVHSVRKKERGYVVSATATLARENRVRFYCLTNQHGRVEDISIEGR